MNHLDQIKTELARIGKDDGWQDIATAPKEHGKAMLVFCSARMNVYTVYWSTYPDQGHWRHFSNNGGQLVEDPTHWQPLPAAPGTPGDKARLRSALMVAVDAFDDFEHDYPITVAEARAAIAAALSGKEEV